MFKSSHKSYVKMLELKKIRTPSFFLAILLTYATAFSIFYFLHRQYLVYELSKKTTALNTIKLVNSGLPIRIKIPKLSVDAAVQNVGVTTEGKMDVPSNSVDVGWFKFGPRPGEIGNAVIAGHFDGENGTSGVFDKLHLLRPGDKIHIENDKGRTTSFIVQVARTYDSAEDVPDVFGQNVGNRLNLITCDGVWVEAQKSYTKRLVIYADIVR